MKTYLIRLIWTFAYFITGKATLEELSAALRGER
jgi:hypothetical protein